MRAAVLLLMTVALSGAQEPTADESRFGKRLAALPGYTERLRLIEVERPPITATLLRLFVLEGDGHLDKDQPGQAAPWYELALHYAEQNELDDIRAQALGNLGKVSDRRGEYQKAIEYYQRAADLGRKTGRHDTVSKNLNGISIVQREQGFYDEALATARESLSLAEEDGNKDLEAQARNSLGNFYDVEGDFRPALEQYLKVLQISQETGSQPGQAYALNNIGDLYHYQGNPELAIEYFQRSLHIKEHLGNPGSIVRTLINLVESLSLVGDNRRAAEYGERALHQAESADDKILLAQTLQILGSVDHAGGKTTRAIERIKQAVRLLDSVNNREFLPSFLAILGEYQVESGQFDAGLASLHRAIAMSRAQGARDALYAACSAAGEAYRKRGRLADARPLLMEAMATVESLGNDVGGADAQQRFLTGRLSPYREMVLVATQQARVDEAFSSAERGRTQTLLGVLREGRVSLSKAMTGEERRQERKLQMQLAALNERLSRAKSVHADDLATRKIESQLQRARLEQADFENVLYATHPELKRQRLDMRPPTPANIAAALSDSKTALLEYVVTGDQTLLFIVTKGAAHPRFVRIPISSAALESKVDELANLIATRSLDYKGAARELGKLLIDPVRTTLAERDSLIIIPDGPLWGLPFQVLESAQGESLLERYTVSFAPSATVLWELLARRPAGPVRTLLALGNPPGANLADAENEVNVLRQLYGPANATVLTGDAATEAAFKAQAGNYDVLHLASHGVIEDRNPLYSYVTLAKGGSEDGFLEAREMLSLNLKARLVVLSACETARGRSGGGEGVIGMTWALFLAGSPATVASGWKVDSVAAARLMVEMHSALRRGLGKAAALRAASLRLRDDVRYQHPFYWAAFSLYGNGR